MTRINPQEYIKDDYDRPRYGEEQSFQTQYCESPACPGIETQWISCSLEKDRWYHLSCAGIPTNKTKEEIEKMEWHCPKCRKARGSKRR
jgi:hypothetical protein